MFRSQGAGKRTKASIVAWCKIDCVSGGAVASGIRPPQRFVSVPRVKQCERRTHVQLPTTLGGLKRVWVFIYCILCDRHVFNISTNGEGCFWVGVVGVRLACNMWNWLAAELFNSKMSQALDLQTTYTRTERTTYKLTKSTHSHTRTLHTFTY